MIDARVTLANITNRVLNTYNTNEKWVVKKMKLEYANNIVAILPIIYQEDKVQYFSNKSIMMIFRADRGKFVNQATIMYAQLVKELIRWENCQKKMVEEQPKKNQNLMYAILPQSYKFCFRRSRITREEEISKIASRGQKKRQCEGEVD